MKGCVLLELTVFLCSNIVYILYILYIIVSMSSLYLCHLVMRIKIYMYIYSILLTALELS